MIHKTLLIGFVLATFVTPVAAMSQYYVAKGTTTHKCSVVSKKPDGKTTAMVGPGMYKSRSGAMRALKAFGECKKI